VTAERIRDKIAASKKKGLWMGGPPPLGYDAKDKQLAVNEAEACTVRRLFGLYLEIGSVRRLKEEADRLGIFTKRRKNRNGAIQGGRPFSRGNLYQLLSNPLYIGRVPHRGETYPGRHRPIVEQESWDAVRHLMAANAVERRASANAPFLSLLTGLVFDETGDRLSPTHAVRNGRRYRYYVSHRLIQARRKDGEGWRLPARELEGSVCNALAALLGNEKGLIDALQLRDRPPGQQQWILRHCGRLARRLAGSRPERRRNLITAIISRIRIEPGRLILDVNRSGLADLVTGGDGRSPLSASVADDLSVAVPLAIKRRGVEAKLVLTQGASREPDDALIMLIARAHRWMHQLTEGGDPTITGLAEGDAEDRNEISRVLPLAFLAPDIIEAIVAGTQPVDLTAKRLKRIGRLPFAWSAQRDLLGFGDPAR